MTQRTKGKVEVWLGALIVMLGITGFASSASLAQVTSFRPESLILPALLSLLGFAVVWGGMKTRHEAMEKAMAEKVGKAEFEQLSIRVSEYLRQNEGSFNRLSQSISDVATMRDEHTRDLKLEIANMRRDMTEGFQDQNDKRHDKINQDVTPRINEVEMDTKESLREVERRLRDLEKLQNRRVD